MAQITMFVICGRMLLFFLPRKEYEKYYRLLFTGMILLLLLKTIVPGILGELSVDELFRNAVEGFEG